jgi:hypothetical protein
MGIIFGCLGAFTIFFVIFMWFNNKNLKCCCGCNYFKFKILSFKFNKIDYGNLTEA